MTPSSDPFPASGFDGWAESYDRTVPGTDGFPFTGYTTALEAVVARAGPRPGMRILDLGTGTGNLAVRFAGLGCEVWATDFSAAMLEKARLKLPGSRLFLHDLRTPLPGEISGPFERIVSAYVFHHFDLYEKVRILGGLRSRLAPGGRIVIADIAFPGQAALEQARQAAGQAWDQEHYWLGDESVMALVKAGWKVRCEQVSECAAVFALSRTRA